MVEDSVGAQFSPGNWPGELFQLAPLHHNARYYQWTMAATAASNRPRAPPDRCLAVHALQLENRKRVSDITAELARFGPAAGRPAESLAAAQAYCRQLARTHYENFAVTNWLIPKNLRAHFYPIYAYCRWADDLADEIPDRAESLRLLDWWQAELDACYAGEARHPIFVALQPTIREFEIPRAPFADLLTAFRQDQRQTRYDSAEDVLGYCRNSANPVGQLVLHLGRCATPDRIALSDSVCTGLQLANFCQDVARDYDRGRIYLPRTSWAEFGYTEKNFAARTENDAFRHLLAHEVARAERHLVAGQPLVNRMPPHLRIQIELFIRGGLAILAKIRQLNYNVWSRRPTVTKWEQAKLFCGAWWRCRRLRTAEATA